MELSGTVKGFLQMEVILSTQPKKVLHVQSISEWAPACIGPYSQAVQSERFIRVAGQIGFCPHTMQLVEPKKQLHQCLKNVHRILTALDSCLQNSIRIVIFIDAKQVPLPEQQTQFTNQVHQYLKESIEDEYTERNKVVQLQSEHRMVHVIPVSQLPRGAQVELHHFAVDRYANVTSGAGKMGSILYSWIIIDMHLLFASFICTDVSDLKEKNSNNELLHTMTLVLEQEMQSDWKHISLIRWFGVDRNKFHELMSQNLIAEREGIIGSPFVTEFLSSQGNIIVELEGCI